MAYLLGVDFDRDAAKLYAKSGEFTEAAWDFMMASSTDLSAFKNHGGKLLIVHGVSDPVFSINDTISWWNDVNRVEQRRGLGLHKDVRGAGHEPLRRWPGHGPV